MIKVQDIVYCVFSAPDLDKMAAFLTDFGMVENGRAGDRLFMRGAGAYPYINVIEKGAPGFVAVGMRAGSAAELEEAARLPGSSAIEAIDAPGGGRRVRLRAPDNYRFDLVHGIEPQSVEAILVQPVSRIGEDEVADHRRALVVVIDRRPPGGVMRVREDG